MNKIVAIGNEEFTLGFELIGIESYELIELEKLISKGNEIGIIIINQTDFDTLSIKLKNDISKLLKPIVVILSADDIKGNTLKEKIIKALGVDLMK